MHNFRATALDWILPFFFVPYCNKLCTKENLNLRWYELRRVNLLQSSFYYYQLKYSINKCYRDYQDALPLIYQFLTTSYKNICCKNTFSNCSEVKKKVLFFLRVFSKPLLHFNAILTYIFT